jgi:hypothetical protein
MPRRDNIEVLVDIIITHQDTQLDENKVVQVYLMLERIIGGLE